MRIWLVLPMALMAVHAALAADSDTDGPPTAPRPRHEFPQPDPPSTSPITDRFALRTSFYSPAVSTDLRLDASNGAAGTPLRAESDLGLPSRLEQGRLELIFRLRERGRLRFDYFEMDRSGNQILSRTINFGNQTFVPGDAVQSELDFHMTGFTYTYSVVRTQRFELGAGIGLHLLDADARGAVPALDQRAETSGVGPFPTAAVDGTWRISRLWSWTARAQYMSATVHGFSGSLGDYHSDLQYRWRPNFSFGVGYSAVRVQLQVTKASEPGEVNLDVRGPDLFFRVSF